MLDVKEIVFHFSSIEPTKKNFILQNNLESNTKIGLTTDNLAHGDAIRMEIIQCSVPVCVFKMKINFSRLEYQLVTE